MRRRDFIALVGATWPLAAHVQGQEKIRRIGYLTAGTVVSGGYLPAFLQGLRNLGWIEGRNIVLERRYADNDKNALQRAAAELVDEKVDVIFAGGTIAPLAAKQATKEIPIIFVSGDPVGAGLVSNLARPEENLTGLSLMSSDVGAKRLELLKELLPRASKAVVLWNAANPYPGQVYAETERAGTKLKMTVKSIEVRDANDFGNAFDAILNHRPDVLVTIEDPLTNSQRKRIADFALQARLPTMHGFREFVTDGGLMAYGADLSDLYRRAAAYVDMVLQGAKPSALPVQQPTKFELIINAKTARSLAITIPPTLLARADEVFE
jgi:putative ABC transport system substrate-binding protein